MNQPEDTCRHVEIDGEMIRVRGAAEMSDESRAALAEVIGAAKRKFAAEHPPVEVTDPERRERYAAALYATLEVSPARHPWETLSPLRRAVWYARADAAMKLADEEHAAEAAAQSLANRAALRGRIAAAMREHWLCTIREEADADGNLPCRCGDWREPGAEVDDENDWDAHLADVALAVLPAAADRAAEELAKHVARAIWALKTPPPPGSQHYRSGWDDGLEAAIDAARDALLRRLAGEQPAPECGPVCSEQHTYTAGCALAGEQDEAVDRG